MLTVKFLALLHMTFIFCVTGFLYLLFIPAIYFLNCLSQLAEFLIIIACYMYSLSV